MNPKPPLSLSLVALTASCVESVDKALLRGQVTTNDLQLKPTRHLKGVKGGCGNHCQKCCKTKKDDKTWLSYCNSGGISCNVGTNKCEAVTSTTKPTPTIVQTTACPETQPTPNDPCFSGTPPRCEYGSESCCNETYVSFVCECYEGTFMCYNTGKS